MHSGFMPRVAMTKSLVHCLCVLVTTCDPVCSENEECNELYPGHFECKCIRGYTRDDTGACMPRRKFFVYFSQ